MKIVMSFCCNDLIYYDFTDGKHYCKCGFSCSSGVVRKKNVSWHSIVRLARQKLGDKKYGYYIERGVKAWVLEIEQLEVGTQVVFPPNVPNPPTTLKY